MAADPSTLNADRSSPSAKQRKRFLWPRCPTHRSSPWAGKSSNGAGATSDRRQAGRHTPAPTTALFFSVAPTVAGSEFFFLCAFVRDLIIRIAMNLLSLPDGRIVNLEHLTHAERMGEYLVLHFSGASDGGSGSVVRLKQGEGERRFWGFVPGKCTLKMEATLVFGTNAF